MALIDLRIQFPPAFRTDRMRELDQGVFADVIFDLLPLVPGSNFLATGADG